ncbi:MAG: hypothetical protein DBY27_05750 [Clostridiaceae bacterium]|nr:MAG: hypothetical protein DBY27_05750 [Clostridiaceae bacterium]
MNQCPKCKSILNNDEKASGKCFSCGATFESNLPQNTILETNYNENTIAKIIKVVAIVILVLGTIGSFASSFHDVYGKNEFSFASFIIPETVTIISGVIFLGFSEVIKLLQEISNKLK